MHLIGSDGHSPRRRPKPRLGGRLRTNPLALGPRDAAADRVCSTNGMLVLQGLLGLKPPALRLPPRLDDGIVGINKKVSGEWQCTPLTTHHLRRYGTDKVPVAFKSGTCG